MEAPTSFLTPLKRLDEYNAVDIHKVLTRLVAIYLPKVRGTTPINEELESLQADDFERSFVIRWLTGFIARGEEWIELYTDEKETLDNGAPTTTSDSSIGRFQTEFSDDTYLARTTAYDRAAALLGACAGTSASGAISRELKFATSSVSLINGPDSSSPIKISLRDESISTGDHTAVGLQTWGSACILAERIARDPAAFGLPDAASTSSSESKGARVLELGAGTGLLSLLAGKLVERAGATIGKGANYTIIATDYHPAVLANLRANVQGNFPDSDNENNLPIGVQPLDWSLYLTGKPTTDLSRAPSTVPTPAVGTPISGSGQTSIDHRISATTLDTQPTSTTGSAISPPIQTPSFSTTSSVSTPATSYSPQTPQTPRTARSPPPNLARAVFSRLIARGLKFEMPGGPPGIDQNPEQPVKSGPYPGSPYTEDELSAHGSDSVHTNFHAVPSLNSDIPTIEFDQMIETKMPPPIRSSSPSLPSDTTRSELLCTNLQDETSKPGADSTGSDNLALYLDEMAALRCPDNGAATFNTGENQRLSSFHTPVPGVQAALIGDMGGVANLDSSNKVGCLGTDSTAGDSTVGTEAPPFKLSERADGLVYDLSLGQRQAPHMPSPSIASTSSLGEPRTPNTTEFNPKIANAEKSDMKIVHTNKDHSDPSSFMSSGNTGGQDEQDCIVNAPVPGTCVEAPFDQPFDVILGADIVYELSHVTLVRGVVERLLRRPSYRPNSPPAYFHLIMPLRPTHADEANSVDMAFPRAEDVVSKGIGEGEVLAITRVETYARSAGVGRADEVQYVHYCVGWV